MSSAQAIDGLSVPLYAQAEAAAAVGITDGALAPVTQLPTEANKGFLPTVR
jgi:hypothetical protein